MSELRLMLLIAGIVLILGIYLYSRRAQNRNTAGNSQRHEPHFETFASESDTVPQSAGSAEKLAEPSAARTAIPASPAYEQADLALPEELRPEPHDLEGSHASTDPGADPKREKVIVIHVSARGGSRFAGPAIVEALTAESLEFGEFDIFHRRSGQRSTFSVASMVEPGRFDLDNIGSLSTPGLSLFLLLPGPDSPVAAFTEMLSTARRLATTLGGEVLDESGSTLSRQAASHLREQIIEFAHRIR